MDHFSLDAIPIPVVFFGLALLLVSACEVGFRLGRYHHGTKADQEAYGTLGPMVSGLLSMLGFLLAFTFSMAASQHADRKKDQLNEAVAIKTAYLQADLLDPTERASIQRLLREYLDTRIAASRPGADIQAALQRSRELQDALWAQVLSESKETADSRFALLRVRSISDLIALGERRVTHALRARIPDGVWVGLILITVLTMITLGVQVGLKGKRRLLGIVPMCLAYSALFALVVDLNTPNTGFIVVGQQAMLDTRAEMGR